MNRNCPECDVEMNYETEWGFERAIQNNTRCKPCGTSGKNNPMYGKTQSPETRDKISKANTGKSIGVKNGMYGKFGKDHPSYGKIVSEETREKLRRIHLGKPKSEEHKQKLREYFTGRLLSDKAKKNQKIGLEKYWNSDAGKKMKKQQSIRMLGKGNPFYGKHHTEETKEKLRKPHTEKTKEKMRISAIKRIERDKFNGNQFYPRYNKNSIPIIDEYGKKYGYNFQHAENGGEVCIGAYWPDGLDENRKTIIEIDEKHHFDKEGNLKMKDVKRQEYLENLGYEVIRIKYERNV